MEPQINEEISNFVPSILYPHTQICNIHCSSAELTVIVSNLSCHAQYIQGTAHFLLTHIRSNPDLLGPHVEPSEAKKLTSKLSSAVGAVQRLGREMAELQVVAESVSTKKFMEKKCWCLTMRLYLKLPFMHSNGEIIAWAGNTCMPVHLQWFYFSSKLFELLPCSLLVECMCS